MKLVFLMGRGGILQAARDTKEEIPGFRGVLIMKFRRMLLAVVALAVFAGSVAPAHAAGRHHRRHHHHKR